VRGTIAALLAALLAAPDVLVAQRAPRDALRSDAEELGELFREKPLGSDRFGHAARVASIVGRAADERGVRPPEAAEKN
jgi:hypothetical protein